MTVIVVLLLVTVVSVIVAARAYAPSRNYVRHRGRHLLAKHVWSKFGPMTPKKFVRMATNEVLAMALQTDLGRVVATRVRIGVHPSDIASWTPVGDEQANIIAARVEERVDCDDAFILPGGKVQVEVCADASAKPHNPKFQLTHAPAEVKTPPVPRRVNQQPGFGTAPTQPLAGPTEPFVHDQRTTPAPQGKTITAHRAGDGRTKGLFVMVISCPGKPDVEVTKTEGVYTGGRHPSCNIVISHPTVSLHHFEVCVMAQGAFIRDLRSTNETTVEGVGNAEKLTQSYPGTVVWLSPEVSLTVIVAAGKENRAA